MKEINLSRTGKYKNKYVAIVDDEDYEYLNQFEWHIHKSYGITYATSCLGSKENLKVRMHRVIMNTPKEMEVDHIDHDGLNNQKVNLRNCTRSENVRNKSAYGSSKYLGVSFDIKGSKKYIRAQICVARKCIGLGRYSTEEEAAKAYDKAATYYFKEFANLNFKP